MGPHEPAKVDAALRARLGPAAPDWTSSPLRLAAVLCPLVTQAGVDHLLFVVRPEHSRQHAGQIAFPGGMRDGSEAPAACALRECHEEVGVPGSAVELLGSLPPRESSSGFLVHCLVGRLQPVTLCTDPREVARVLHVPLDLLRDDDRWQERQPPPTATGRQPPRSPHFDFGRDLLWGLTARFVRDLVAALR
jgi:8-oxo-dGTP pyrophosphatase MutT (NUDIX family)